MNRSIVSRMAAIIFITIFATLSLAGAISYLHERDVLIHELSDQEGRITNRISFNLALPVWDFIFNQRLIGKVTLENASKIIADEMVSTNVKAIIVYGNFGKIFMGKVRNGRGVIVNYDPLQHTVLLRNAFSKTSRTIMSGGVSIGRVDVYLTDEALRERLFTNLVITLLTIISVSLITVFILYSALKRSIINPVIRLSHAIGEMSGGNLNTKVEISSDDEVGALASSFNTMTSQLKGSFHKITSQFEELQRVSLEREQAEEARRKSEEMFTTTFMSSPDSLALNRLSDGKIIEVNDAFLNTLGYSRDEVIGKTTWELDSWAHPEDRKKYVATLLKNGSVFGMETVLCANGGRIIPVLISGRIIDIQGQPCSISIVHDITERKQAEAAIVESRNYLNEIINSVADPIFVKDRQHRWVLLNEAFCSFMGRNRDELLGKSDYDFFPRKEAEIFWEKDEAGFTSGAGNINEENFTDSEGIVHTIVTKKTLYTNANGEQSIVGVIRDITELRRADEERARLESQLSQAQKMETIGTLAGGIAHDFNNILAAIIGYAELAQYDLQKPDKVQSELVEILKAANRAKDLVKQILTFSRKTETRYLPLELPSLVKESIKMLRSVIPTTIEIRQDIMKSGLIMTDPTQMHQIIMNLCTNAVHAMDVSGGILEVRLKKEHITDDTMARDLDLTPGPYFRLTISDTGHGMPPAVKEKIFDPYFTTKEKGRGTGLGLSVVHGIVKNHQGAITCKSSPGEGTDFDIYLPALDSGRVSLKPLDDVVIQKGSERILFIDDEPVLVTLTKIMLCDLGYDVATATNSLEALEVFRRSPHAFDLVITDMTMPGMTGDRLAQNLMAIRRDIPIIICTGYSEHISEENAKSIGIREFLMKPLEMKQLANIIRKVLDQRKL